MKYDVCLIAESMFWWFPAVLDLATGKVYTIYNKFSALEVVRLDSPKRIPHYSEAPVYRKYLEIASASGAASAGSLLARCPRFEFIQEFDPEPVGAHYRDTEEITAFYKEADILCASLSASLGILDLTDFLEEYEIEFAKGWCKQEGLEWYDRRPESRRHTLPDAAVCPYRVQPEDCRR